MGVVLPFPARRRADVPSATAVRPSRPSSDDMGTREHIDCALAQIGTAWDALAVARRFVDGGDVGNASLRVDEAWASGEGAYAHIVAVDGPHAAGRRQRRRGGDERTGATWGRLIAMENAAWRRTTKLAVHDGRDAVPAYLPSPLRDPSSTSC